MTGDLLDIIDSRVDDAIARAVAKRDGGLKTYAEACDEIRQLHAVKLVRRVDAEATAPKLVKTEAA
jgi:hypothetical protein